MQSMTIETTPDKIFIILDKTHFNQDAIIAMVKFIKIEAMAHVALTIELSVGLLAYTNPKLDN